MQPLGVMKRATEASVAKEAALALNQTTDVAKRLQAIFDRTKGDPGIAESLAKTRDAAGDLARGFGDMAGLMRAAVNAGNDAPRADDPWSQPLPGDSSRIAKHLDGKSLAAAMAASEPAKERATGPEAAGRDVAAKRSERRQIPKDERPGEEVPAAPLGASEATGAAPEKPRPATDAPTDGAQPAAPAKPLGAPGASGDLESRLGIGIRAEAGERADARNRGGPASTQPERDAMPAGDPIEPAIKALLSEMAKMQDQRMHGLRQAVDVIATHADAMDGLIQFMQTIAAHQEQLRADVNDHGQQLAAWARATQIP